MLTAMWLLLLGASIVAFLMLANINHSEELSFERKLIQLQDAQESALETAIANIIFNGSESDFAMLPAQAVYEIDGVATAITVSSENGKVDLNQADAELIRRALRGLAVSGVPREKFMIALQARRNTDQSLRSIADAEILFQQAGIGAAGDFCAERYFTVFSGQPQPQPSQMDPKLARALGEASLAKSERFRAGNALRVEVKADMGLPLMAVVRTSGLLDRSHTVLDWGKRKTC